MDATSRFNFKKDKSLIVGIGEEIASELDQTGWQLLSAGRDSKGKTRRYDWHIVNPPTLMPLRTTALPPAYGQLGY